MDTDLPSKWMIQPISGLPEQQAPTSSQPTSPPPQLLFRDSMTPSKPSDGFQPHQRDFSLLEMPRNITGHRLSSLETGQSEEDGGYVKMTRKPQSYFNIGCFEESKMTDGHESVTVEQDPLMKNIYPILPKVPYKKNINDLDKMNPHESQRISHDSRFPENEGFKCEIQEASSNDKMDPTESYINTSSHKTEDDADRFCSLNSEGYVRIKELDHSDVILAGVYRETKQNFKPLTPRPFNSAEFPLPPTPEVEKRPFSEGDVDNKQKKGQPNECFGSRVTLRFVHQRLSQFESNYSKGCFQALLLTEVFPMLTQEAEDTVSKLKLPDPVELKDLNPQILKFLMKNKKHKQLFEKNLSDVYGVASWPSSLEDCVIIQCTVKMEDKNASPFLTDWCKKVMDKVDTFTASIEVAEFNMIQIAWPRVLKELGAVHVDNPEDVGVFIEQDKYSITLVGPRGIMENLKESVLDTIAMVIAEINHERQRIKETKQMQTYAILLLEESHFKQDIKKMYPGLQFDLNLKEKIVTFVGQADIVQKAVVQMHGKLQSFVSRSMQMSKPVRDLLFGKEITEYIKQKMKSQKVIGVWDVVCKEEVRMFAWDEREVQKAIQLVRDCLVEQEMTLDDAMAENVKGQQWLQLVEKIQEKHKHKVAIETSKRSILVVAKDDIFQDIFSKIKDYLKEHSVKEFVLTLNLVKMKYIKRYKMEDIKALEKKFESLNVKLSIIDYGDQQGIKIKGRMDGCNTLETALTDMAINVITKEHAMVSKDGLKELFQCSRGREELSLIEGRWKCLIELKNSGTSVSIQAEGASGGYSSESEDDADKSNELSDMQPSSDSSATSIDACGIKVSFIRGELALQRVDVIVNSTNQKLDLRIGAISKSIIKYGGDTIQRECLQHYPNGISPGQVVVTGGGNLSCMNVYHGCLRAYDGGKGKSLKLMKTFVKNCLKQADKTGFHSMAFPALGTGNLRFPADEVGKLILQCIQNFGKKRPKTSLKDIALVVFPSDITNIKAVNLKTQPSHMYMKVVRLKTQPSHVFIKAVRLKTQPSHVFIKAVRLKTQPSHVFIKAVRLKTQPSHVFIKAVRLKT
ncbi:hypothetical protein CHS0354_013664 [Potamilus streckersoni]|uniref:Macro domain-containing protein n=1 Tax=Potamilus streckersoni TaxID=2493646 RepID=A0AAE0W2R5_9BIVA|nr:hypothetical protein CHS0354_013664 [Potamilus streckersoni]